MTGVTVAVTLAWLWCDLHGVTVMWLWRYCGCGVTSVAFAMVAVTWFWGGVPWLCRGVAWLPVETDGTGQRVPNFSQLNQQNYYDSLAVPGHKDSLL